MYAFVKKLTTPCPAPENKKKYLPPASRKNKRSIKHVKK